MNVLGFDPDITVDAAWSLPSQVRRATSVNDVLKQAQFVTLHVPLVDATRHLVNDGQHRPDAARRGAAQLQPRGRRQRQRGARRAGREPARPVRLRLPRQGAARPGRRDRPAAPRRVDARGRGQLRGDGRRPAARLPRERQPRQRGQLPAGDDGARVGLPRRHRQRQRAEHARPDLDRDGAGRAQHPQHGEQVARRDGVHAGRRRQPGASRRAGQPRRDQRRARGALPAGA